MKTVVLWVCLLGAVICGDYTEPRCGANPSSIKFTLRSYRNQSGHWTAQVQLEHTDVEEDAAAWDVDIDHTFAPRCDGPGAVLVVATITVPPKGNAVVKPRPQKRTSIPAGYRKFSESHYFGAHLKASIWVEARDICEKEGAHLAVINSEAEAKFVSSLWTSTLDWAYIGTHDLYVEGKYVTLYNETLSDAGYDRWYAGEPNGGTSENCGVINRNTLLGNYFCNLPLPFFCELQY
uniref:Putative LPSBP5 n=1 Tax=Reticulitermes speratus TaxID=60591 RepID=A0A1V1G515_9NEOP